MRSLVTFLAVLVGLGLNIATAQEYVFKVLVNKGDNKAKASGAEWQPVKTGSKLNNGDQIKVSEGAYLGLVHSSGKTIELKNADVYNVSDISSKISGTNSSVASKYADFVLSKMSSEGEEDINANHRNYMSVTGAVERATTSAALNVMMPSSVEVLNNEAIVRWTEPKEAAGKAYVVTLKNMFDETILTKETTETSVTLNFDDPKLAKEKLVILKVSVKGEAGMESGEYGIKRLSGQEAQTIEVNLNSLQQEVSGETALDKLILASFYEENNLLVDALTMYEQAIKMSPDVPEFKDAYAQFLIRNGLGNK